ncbi:translocator protein [Halyomorpha halys]|uniref:translocator protein n=1 Tax=Halyomorpha halys TaxID=286706 RepID=UPI0006D51717|nr:translocator protein [Halyomorpha halys]
MSSDLIPMVGAIALPHLGGIVGARLYPAKTPWYDGLKKSRLVPPNWVFPVAWTSLYSGMGYASYLVWKSGGGFEGDAKIPLLLYGTQLLLNWAWTPIFFGAHNIKGGLIDLAIMVPTAASCALAFNKVNNTAGWLMAPYVAWLGFASYLNLRILQLNGDDKKSAKDKN